MIKLVLQRMMIHFLNFALVQNKENLISFWFQNLPALGKCHWNVLLMLIFRAQRSWSMGYSNWAYWIMCFALNYAGLISELAVIEAEVGNMLTANERARSGNQARKGRLAPKTLTSLRNMMHLVFVKNHLLQENLIEGIRLPKATKTERNASVEPRGATATDDRSPPCTGARCIRNRI